MRWRKGRVARLILIFLRVGRGLNDFDGGGDDSVELAWADFQAEFAGNDARDVQHVFDELSLRLGAAVDGFDALRANRGHRKSSLSRMLAQPTMAFERRAHFVAERWRGIGPWRGWRLRLPCGRPARWQKGLDSRSWRLRSADVADVALNDRMVVFLIDVADEFDGDAPAAGPAEGKISRSGSAFTLQVFQASFAGFGVGEDAEFPEFLAEEVFAGKVQEVEHEAIHITICRCRS